MWCPPNWMCLCAGDRKQQREKSERKYHPGKEKRGAFISYNTKYDLGIIVFSIDSVQLWPPTHVHLYTICIRVLAHKYKAVSIATVDLILLLVVDILSCSVRPTVDVIPHTDTLSTACQREQGGRLLH